MSAATAAAIATTEIPPMPVMPVMPPVANPAAAPLPPAEPKVNPPHAWTGRAVYYWRVSDLATGALSAMPAMLIEPSRQPMGNKVPPGQEGWELNSYRRGQMMGRSNVKYSEKPKAGCWSWMPVPALTPTPAPAPAPSPDVPKTPVAEHRTSGRSESARGR